MLTFLQQLLLHCETLQASSTHYADLYMKYIHADRHLLLLLLQSVLLFCLQDTTASRFIPRCSAVHAPLSPLVQFSVLVSASHHFLLLFVLLLFVAFACRKRLLAALVGVFTGRCTTLSCCLDKAAAALLCCSPVQDTTCRLLQPSLHGSSRPNLTSCAVECTISAYS
jgi:hypothetical protein